jgi:ribulose 1,5-bisphosphate synthetase/thiazole synthase
MKSMESSSSAQVLKKTQPEEFDLVVLGGGTGGTIAAWTFAGQGKRVAVIERKYIGGSCQKERHSQGKGRIFLSSE